MAILIDPPRWPAHGTVFGHLVSDASLDELHDFASRAGLPTRAFDHDHYDVPESRYPALLQAGATLVRERDLVRRLIASGLRVHAPQKAPTRSTALSLATSAWRGLGLPDDLRDDLIRRWVEPHRHYHDIRHLAQCLDALTLLGGATRATTLAAWFHDAVYEGRPGDEEASANLAERSLGRLVSGTEVDEVARLVRMTAEHNPADPQAGLLSDADLSVLGQVPGRYHVYLRDVRLDFEHLDDETWRRGRLQVVGSLLAVEPLFHTVKGRAFWGDAARANLEAERDRLADA